MEDNKKTENKKSGLTGKNGNEPRKAFNPKFNVYYVYGAIALFLIMLSFWNQNAAIKEIGYGEFKRTMLADGDIERIVVVNGKDAEIFLRENSLTKYFPEDAEKVKVGPQYTTRIATIDKLEEELQEAEANLPEGQSIDVTYDDRPNYLGDIISWIFPFLLIIGIWIFLMRRMSSQSGGGAGGIFSVGKSKAKLFDKESNIKINFKDVAGLVEAKQEVEEIVSFLKNPGKYTDLGGKIPKGALLVGPPGTGKTLMAKAVAGEANVPFFSLSGSDFVEMFVGVGASRVRDLFKQAKEKSPCIVFIDEIDAIGRARGKNAGFGANDERENTLNQLLTEMDGFGTNSGVIILAATNRADILDGALMRAGRFDRQIHVELPDLNERKDIFGVHLRPLKISENIDSGFLARQTPGFSGADIANVCNEAALIAARHDKKNIEKQDFLDAVDRIVGGLEKKNKIITLSEKTAIAYHEAGHAATSWLLEHAHPLVKVTIVPRGKALGAAWYLPEERQLTTKEQMLDEMCATLGGRAAEDLVFNKISSGALNDLERVTKSAYGMVSYLGMSERIGNLSFYDSSGSEYSFTKPYSDKTAEAIDEEVRKLVEEQYVRAKKLLSDNAGKHKQLAEILLKKEVIFTEDLIKIFGERPFKKEIPLGTVNTAPSEDANAPVPVEDESRTEEVKNEKPTEETASEK